MPQLQSGWRHSSPRRLLSPAAMFRPPYPARVGPTTPKQFGTKHQPCPHLAVHGPPNGSLAARAAEMGAAIRCSLAGAFPRERETADPLTSNPEPWSPPSSFFRHWYGPCWISAPFCTFVTL